MDEQLTVMKQPHRKKQSKQWIYIYNLIWARTEVKVNFKVQFTPKAQII
jgi:hypothetical protein